MTLQEALSCSTDKQFIARRKWRKNGTLMHLCSSSKTIEELNVDLTDESLNADDWEIFEVKDEV